MEGFVQTSLSFLFGKICRFVICIESSSDFQTKQFSNKFACNIRQSSEKRMTTDKCIDLSVGQLQTKRISMPSNAAYFLFEASIRNTFSKVLYFLKRYFLKISWKYIFFLLFFTETKTTLSFMTKRTTKNVKGGYNSIYFLASTYTSYKCI